MIELINELMNVRTYVMCVYVCMYVCTYVGAYVWSVVEMVLTARNRSSEKLTPRLGVILSHGLAWYKIRAFAVKNRQFGTRAAVRGILCSLHTSRVHHVGTHDRRNYCIHFAMFFSAHSSSSCGAADHGLLILEVSRSHITAHHIQ